MRLFMDGRYIRTDYHDGISRFSHSLIHAVAQQAQPTVIIHDPKQRELLPDHLEVVQLNDPTALVEPLAAQKLNRYQPDVVFSPMQTIGSVGRKFGLILTLHDLIYYQHRTPPRDLPQLVRGLWYLYHLSYVPQRLLLNGADAVATVSQTSQRLIRKHRLTSRPVHVISNAPQTFDHPRDPSQGREKALVYMGSFMEYKNVEVLVQAMRYLPEYRLHLCSPITAQRRRELLGLAIQHRIAEAQLVFHNGISDTHYRELLRTSTALVTLSRSEGYGLPVAEAMAEGTPVVLSKLEIFEEIGGSKNPGAFFIDMQADNIPQLVADAVTKLDDDATFRVASKAVVHQANRFRWEDSATTLLQLAEAIHRRRQLSAR